MYVHLTKTERDETTYNDDDDDERTLSEEKFNLENVKIHAAFIVVYFTLFPQFVKQASKQPIDDVCTFIGVGRSRWRETEKHKKEKKNAADAGAFSSSIRALNV